MPAAEQLQLDLEAPTAPATVAVRPGLSSPWCAVPPALLADVWEKVEPQSRGTTRFKLQMPDGEYVELYDYQPGWAIIAQGRDHMGYMGSCMSSVAVCRLLRRFLRAEEPLTIVTVDH